MQLASRRILTLGAVALGLGSQWALGRGRPVEGGAGLALAAAAVVVGAAPEARVVLDLAHPPAALPTPDRSSVAAWVVASAAVVISTITFDVASPSTVDWLAYLLSLVAVGVAVWMADLGRTHGPVRPAPDPLALARRMPRWAWRVALGCALVGAIAAATIALDSVPRGLWFDEAETGLQARRLLHDSSYRPVWIDGSYAAPALHAVLVAGSFSLLGESVASLRLVSVLLGAAGVLGAYLVGRELAGPAVGVAAAATLAATRWYLTLERIAMFNIAVPAFGLLTVGFMLRGWRRGRAVDHALAGAAAGVGMCFYSAFAASLAAVAVLVAAVVIRWRHRVGALLGGALIAAAVALAIVAPVARFVLSDPDTALDRQRQTSLFSAEPPDGRLDAVVDNAAAYVRMFNLRGDGNGRHNDPGEPQLSPWISPLAVLGLALALAALRRPLAAFLVAWSVLALVPGVLSLPFEAPNSLRAVGALAPLVLLALVLGAVVALQWRDERWWTKGAVGLVVVAVFTIAGATDLAHYFGAQANDDTAWAVHSTAETFAAEVLRDAGPEVQVWLTEEFRDVPTIEFLSPHRRADGFFGTDDRLPLPIPSDRDLVIVTTPATAAAVEGLSELYPNATLTERRRVDGSPSVALIARIPAADLAAVQGYDELVGADGPGALVERRAVLVAPDTWTREIALDGATGVVELDGATLVDHSVGIDAATVTIAEGRHDLRILTLPTDTAVPADTVLSWREPGGEWEPIPEHLLYRPPVQPWGLAARHISGEDPAAEVAFTTVDPVLDLRFHVLRLPRPYVIRWEGALLVPSGGAWRFQVGADDPVSLTIDGQLVAETSGGGSDAIGDVDLAEGRHDIEVVYRDLGSFSRVTLRWAPPGGSLHVVPASALRPPWAPHLPPAAATADPIPAPEALETLRSERLDGAAGVATGADGQVYAVGPAGVLVLGPDDRTERTGLSDASATDVAVLHDGRVVVLMASGHLEVIDTSGRPLAIVAPPVDLANARGIAAIGPATVAVAHTPGSRVVVVPIDSPGDAAVRWEDPGAQPIDVVADTDGALHVLVADRGLLVSLDADGTATAEWPLPPDRTVAGPHLAVDPATGEVWRTETSSARLVVIDTTDMTDPTARAGTERAHLAGDPPLHPAGIAVAADGSIWVTDADAGVVVRLDR